MMHGVIELRCGCLICWHLHVQAGRHVPFYDGTKLVDECGLYHDPEMLDVQALLDQDQRGILRDVSRS